MVHDVLAQTVGAYGERNALHVKRGGAWCALTWRAYQREVGRAARALIGLGVERGQAVVLLGGNSPEWAIANLGSIFAGAMPAGIYATSSAEQVRTVADHCEAKVAFADTPEQIAKFCAEQARLPNLQVVVQLGGQAPVPAGGALRVLGWEDFLALADGIPERELAARLTAQKPDDVCTLIYTSGTTGAPKAVMLTHGNLVWSGRALSSTLAGGVGDVYISYLPLSHVAEQILSIHGAMALGWYVYFVKGPEELGAALGDVRPTLVLGVPRVWEKMQAKMSAAGAGASPLRRKVLGWARKTGLAAGIAEERGARGPLLLPIAKKLVFDPARRRLGLDRARLCVTSTAPIGRDTLDHFLSFGIRLVEIYGMSECTGAITCAPPGHYRTGTCGRRLPGTELEIGNDGEIRVRGEHVFKGYLKDPVATREALDDEGWLHTGDVGELDEDGFLRITDRKKDLLITAGGENIAPQMLEARLTAIPVVSRAVVLGDRRRYVAALISLHPERVASEAELAGSSARSLEEAARCAKFHRHLERQIAIVNQQLAHVQTIKRFAILPVELSIDGGELTPTMKLKRKLVSEKYSAEIEALYVQPS